MDPFVGVIIEESLADKSVLGKVKIIQSQVERITEKHKTPWLKQWTLHTVEIPAGRARMVAGELSRALDQSYWYADFKNTMHHFIVFRDKIFYIDRKSKAQYDEARRYGLSLGIPEYQLDFHPETKEWKR